jgi:hypothetical protein
MDKKFRAELRKPTSLYRLTLLRYLIVVYLTTLPVSETTQRLMTGRSMNNELERIWKEVIVA